MAKISLYTINDNYGAGIRLLGAYLRERGHKVHLVLLQSAEWVTRSTMSDDWLSNRPGSEFDGYTYHCFQFTHRKAYSDIAAPPAFLNYLQDWQPDIVGFSGRSSGLARFCPTWFPAIRAAVPNAILIAGGHGPSTAPERYLDAGADMVGRGEGEDALAELAACVDAKSSWKAIRNLSWKDGEEYRHNPLRPMLTDLDCLPLPLSNTPGILHIEGERLSEKDPLVSKPMASILTSRGCIGSCSYCASGNWRNMYEREGLKAPKYRWRSTEHLLREMQFHKAHGKKGIALADDFFIRPPQEMLNFFQRYKQEIGLPLTWLTMPPMFLERHPEIFDAAIDAGLSVLRVPAQAGDSYVGKRIFTRTTDYQQLLRLARKAADNYLEVQTHFIDGCVFDEHDDLEAKLNFVSQLPPFDPRFPYGTCIAVFYLRVADGTPLARNWPDLNSRLLSVKEFAYRNMLMQLRYLLNDEEFTALRANTRYKDDPRPLAILLTRLRRMRHNAYMLEQARRLAGKEVYFWGCGEIYQARKDLFFGCKPQAILLDVASPLRELDGIKVRQAKDVLREGNELPIVIFSNKAQKIARALNRMRPGYHSENIITCQTVS